MNKDVMAKTAQLDDFDEQLYKVRPFKLNADYRSWTVQMRNTSLQHPNNPSLLSIWTNGSPKTNYQNVTPATVPVSVAKQVPTAKKPGESSESTNSKKYVPLHPKLISDRTISTDGP